MESWTITMVPKNSWMTRVYILSRNREGVCTLTMTSSKIIWLSHHILALQSLTQKPIQYAPTWNRGCYFTQLTLKYNQTAGKGYLRFPTNQVRKCRDKFESIIKYLKRIIGVGGENLSSAEPEPDSEPPLDVLRMRSATPFTMFMLPSRTSY